MLITCPSCASAYDLPADRIGATGRKVRCASCRESWFVASPEDNAEVLPSLDCDPPEGGIEIVARPLPPPTVARERAEPAPHPRGKRRSGRRPGAAGTPRNGLLARVTKVAAVLAVCAALPALLAFREKVVAATPGTASLYRAVGLPVNLVGLSFAGVSSTLSTENGTPVLEVRGEIVNGGRTARAVPYLQISLAGEAGEALYTWSAKAAEGELAVGQVAPFRVRLTAPPPAARKVEVTFREERGRRTASRI